MDARSSIHIECFCDPIADDYWSKTKIQGLGDESTALGLVQDTHMLERREGKDNTGHAAGR